MKDETPGSGLGFMTEMMAGALQLHESYETFRQAGFTTAQAFELVRTITAAGVTASIRNDGDAS